MLCTFINSRIVKTTVMDAKQLAIFGPNGDFRLPVKSVKSWQFRRFFFGLITNYQLEDKSGQISLSVYGWRGIKGQPINQFLTYYIESVFRGYHLYAIGNYLRDNMIGELDSRLVPIVEMNRTNPDVFKQHCKSVNLKLISYALKYFPVSKHVEVLRDNFIEREGKKWKGLLDQAESNPLNDSQRRAVLLDNHYNLVNAAAGTGKSSVMVAKAMYLVESGKCSPEEVLILAFAADAAKELETRMVERVNDIKECFEANKSDFMLKQLESLQSIKIKTFHALGLEVLKANDHPRKLSDWVQDKAGSSLAQEETLQSFILEEYGSYFSKLKIKEQDAIESVLYGDDSNYEFDGAEQFENFLNENRYYSLQRSVVLAHLATNDDKGKPAADVTEFVRMNYWLDNNEAKNLKFERLRSFQEMKIANWLFIHGIEYRYEKSFKEIQPGFNSKYNPDFYLPEYGIVFEHYGIDRNNRTRPGIDAKKYMDSIEWKRQVMEEYGYLEGRYFETFSYQFTEGTINEFLNTELVKKIKVINPDFELKQISDEALAVYFQEHARRTKQAKLLLNAVGSIRASNLDAQQILHRMKGSKIKSPVAIGNLFTHLANSYAEQLALKNEIDFDDMISISQKYLGDSTNSKFRYKYILVDEFQDISQARMDLVKALIAKNEDCSFTGVGDDWQSIFRFAGGQLNLITQFDKQVGSYSSATLNETYRYKQQIADIAGGFVMTNKHQLEKTITSKAKFTHQAAFHVDYNWNCVDDMYGDQQNQDILKDWLNERIPSLPDYEEGDIIGVLLRYKGPRENLIAKLDPRKQYLWWTMHGSKGREADHIIVLDLFSDQFLNFPSTIENHIAIEPLMPEIDKFKDAEERRLFYVALTRAKKTVVLITSNTYQSYFVGEIIGSGIEIGVVGEAVNQEKEKFKCSDCATGYLKPWNNNENNLSCDQYICEGFSFKCNTCNSNPMKFSENKYRCISDDCRGDMTPSFVPGIKARPCGECGLETILRCNPKSNKLFLSCVTYDSKKSQNCKTMNLLKSEIGAFNRYFGTD